MRSEGLGPVSVRGSVSDSLNFAVCLFGSLWVVALIVVLGAMLRRRSNGKATSTRKALIVLSAAYLLATTAAVPYSFYIEPYWSEVVHVEIESPKLEGNKPIRIVHLSDLHSDPKARLEDEIPKIVARLEPTLVVITGDGVNSREGIPTFRRCVKALAAQHPTYAVKGNWESWWFKGIDVFDGTGVVELDGDSNS